MTWESYVSYVKLSSRTFVMLSWLLIFHAPWEYLVCVVTMCPFPVLLQVVPSCFLSLQWYYPWPQLVTLRRCINRYTADCWRGIFRTSLCSSPSLTLWPPWPPVLVSQKFLDVFSIDTSVYEVWNEVWNQGDLMHNAQLCIVWLIWKVSDGACGTEPVKLLPAVLASHRSLGSRPTVSVPICLSG